MRKSKPDSKDETYFDSLKKKLLNHKIIVYVIIFTIIISGITVFLGNVDQIRKFFQGDKKSISQTNNSKNNDSLRIDSVTDRIQPVDSAKKKPPTIEKVGLDKDFESPPAHLIKEKQSENNPELGIASIKIRDSIAWSETVFAKEEKNKIIRILSQKGYSDEAMQYRIYDRQYLKESDQIFELGRYKEYIDPCFDITLLNNGQSAQILSRIGIEIREAYFTVISLGDIGSEKINVTGRYKIEFPPPEKVSYYGDIINLKKNNLELSSYGNHISIRRRNSGDTTPVKTIKGKLIEANFLFQMLEFSYADLPKTIMIDLHDPIYIEQNKAFRFLLQITNSQYIPTETLMKFVFETNKGIKLSKPIYLLKP